MRSVALGGFPVLVLVGSLVACGDRDASSYEPPPLGDLEGGTSGSGGTPGSSGGDGGKSGAGEGGGGATGGLAPGGANPSPLGGVDFRLWAPHATAVRVTGEFPEASVTMQASAGGVYTAHVAGAHAGQAYSFLLDTPAGTLTRMDPYCREVSGTACRIVDPAAYAWKATSFVSATREQSIVYELHVGSFGSTPTFASTTAKLAELADLGINVIELMPVTAGGTGVSWGYGPELWQAPRPSYGSPDELRTLVDTAHAHGIAVWLDVVVNHYTGNNKAPLYCFDGNCPNGSAGALFFPDGSQYQKTPWGPRPNFQEKEVSRLLVGAAQTWLDEYRGDGFRWDSVSNIRALDGNGQTPGGKELLVAANALTHARGKLSVAEDLKGYAAVTQKSSAGGLDFDAQWDGFGYDMTAQLANAADSARDLGVVANALTGGYAGDPFARVLFLEDHDTVGNGGLRLPNRIDGADPESFAARRRAMLGGVLLLTTPGVPMLFQGEEQLATGTFDSQPTPLPAPTAKGLGMRAFYKDMIALRRTLAGLSGAKVEVFHRNDAAKVIAFERGGVIVVVNLANKAYSEYDVGVSLQGPYTVKLNTESTAYGADFVAGQSGKIATKTAAKDGRPYTLPLVLGAYAAMVLAP
jgi:1,4-alpha-glucan branching enzyme